jgi:hypothetical protein
MKKPGLMSIGSLIGMILVVVVLGALMYTVTDNTIGIANTKNVSGATGTLVTLIPLFLVIAVVISFVKEV